MLSCTCSTLKYMKLRQKTKTSAFNLWYAKWSEARKFWIWIMKSNQILKKDCARQSEAKNPQFWDLETGRGMGVPGPWTPGAHRICYWCACVPACSINSGLFPSCSVYNILLCTCFSSTIIYWFCLSFFAV